jgi:signal transduction histidine kinase
MSKRRWTGIVRPWPKSLFGRIALILFSGLAAAHVLTFGLLVYDRAQAVSAMMVAYLAKDMASSLAILERVPAEERETWLPKIDRKHYRYRLALPPADASPASAAAQRIAATIARELGPRIPVTALTTRQATDPLDFELVLKLDDGTPLTLQFDAPETGVSSWVLGALAFQLATLGLFTWIAVRIATQPLARLADAANRLKPHAPARLLPETGPQEVLGAAIAFNAMQRRIADHVAERVRILAAISHDLQSPITRMRLRTDLLDDLALRQKLQCDLTAMQRLIEQGIDLARSSAPTPEALAPTDIQALLESLVYDYAESGRQVSLCGHIDGPVVTAPHALRRIITNLTDNALKFGEDVEISVGRDVRNRISIEVSDRGPGIPEAELDAVLVPFHRVEASRSRETGGAGLGLAIASQLAIALNGELRLTNRDGGGLVARLTLPTVQAGHFVVATSRPAEPGPIP